MPGKTKKTRRVNKAEWLDMALEILETEGISGVRVEVLAKRLGISKSGFYWHFRDRQELLDDLLDYWSHEITEIITANPEIRTLSPRDRLFRTAEMILEYDLPRFEIAIRQWALHDAVAARAVRKVNRTRVSFVEETLAELGFKGDELEMRSMLFACYETWESPMYREISRKRRRALISRRVDLITGK